MTRQLALAGVIAMAATSTVAQADIFQTYEDLSEGFLGTSFTHGGVTYRDVNNVSGVFPDSSTFGPGELGNQVIVENAAFFYNDFPTYGSPINALTFGSAYVEGENLSIGALASVYMDLDQQGNAASLNLAFYENGPWGGMVYHLDALLSGQVVASDTFSIANGGGRDNATWQTLSVSGATFDSLHLYGTWNGEYTGPRGMIDNLSITTPVPEPATLTVLGIAALLSLRKRRKA